MRSRSATGVPSTETTFRNSALRPVLKRMLALTDAEHILRPQAIYGYWKCAGQGNDLVLFEADGITEACRFSLPRQPKQDGECIADFVRDLEDGPGARDVIGLQVVTVGQKASDMAREWFDDNRYQDYLYLHGLSVEMAEAMAVSARTLHRQLVQETGQTPAAWLRRLRIEAACRLLAHPGLSIKQVAQRSGFGNEYNMRRAFNLDMGVGPSEYRAHLV